MVNCPYDIRTHFLNAIIPGYTPQARSTALQDRQDRAENRAVSRSLRAIALGYKPSGGARSPHPIAAGATLELTRAGRIAIRPYASSDSVTALPLTRILCLYADLIASARDACNTVALRCSAAAIAPDTTTHCQTIVFTDFYTSISIISQLLAYNLACT